MNVRNDGEENIGIGRCELKRLTDFWNAKTFGLSEPGNWNFYKLFRQEELKVEILQIYVQPRGFGGQSLKRIKTNTVFNS
jgi:hypothetical protein